MNGRTALDVRAAGTWLPGVRDSLDRRGDHRFHIGDAPELTLSRLWLSAMIAVWPPTR